MKKDGRRMMDEGCIRKKRDEGRKKKFAIP
jgi:hypothetical protein